MNARFMTAVVVLCAWGALACGQPLRAADTPQGSASADGASGAVASEAAADPHSAGSAETAGHGHDARDFQSPPLYISFQLILFTLILFGLYFFAMRGMAWQPIIDGLNEREARVLKAERDAATAKAEAARFHEVAEKRMTEVQAQVKEILAQSRVSAEAQKMQIVKDAELEATRVKEQALAEIAAAREQAMAELSLLVDGQAALAASRITGRP